MDLDGRRHVAHSVNGTPSRYDPIFYPELYANVPERRAIAFVIDMAIIMIPVFFVTVFIFLFGLVTLGLGWSLFFFVTPGTVIWALLYYGATMGGSSSATLGMRAVGLEIRTTGGAPCHFLLGAVHPLAFWVLTTSLTPFVLLIAYFNERKRLLHDILLGTMVINNERRAAGIRYGWGIAR
jgi:uncharacterized RDD family membrane protein YckC